MTDTKRLREFTRRWSGAIPEDITHLILSACDELERLRSELELAWSDEHDPLKAENEKLRAALTHCRDCLLCREGAHTVAAIDAADAALKEK